MKIKDLAYSLLMWFTFSAVVLAWYWSSETGFCFDGILFHLQYGKSFLVGNGLLRSLNLFVLITFFFTLFFYIVFFCFFPQRKGLLVVLLVMCCWGYIVVKLKVVEYFKLRFSENDFYERNWVLPEAEFEKNKRPNLILLTLESIEDSFSNKNYWNENLISGLDNKRRNGYSFSGFNSLSGTWWTMGSVIGSWCGIPLILPSGINMLYSNDYFIAGARCLSDILKDNGYELFYIKGSMTKFAGMDIFLKNHGYKDKDVLDWIKLVNNNPDLPVGEWGVYDREVYSVFKDKIIELSKQNTPFFAAMQTIDTHYKFQELSKNCEGSNDSMYDVIRCADKQASEFVDWFFEQDFKDDTVLVVMGDHLFMDKFVPDIKFPENGRTVFNLFINSRSAQTINLKRKFTSLDIFPTILESLGMKVKNNRAG